MIQTVLGQVQPDNLGIFLPHEHVLVGFVPDGKLRAEDYRQDEVIRLMLPRLEAFKAAGGSALAECTPEFLGRDVALLVALSRLSGVHLLTNTGYYQAPYLAPFVHQASPQQLADIWIQEAREGIQGSDVKPGFIKIALSNGGPLPPVQRRILQAAMITARETGLSIQAHTVGGVAALEALALMQQEGFDLRRFIWVHADSEPDTDIHQRLADAGAWLSIDSIGWRPLEEHGALVMKLMDMGLAPQLLLSHDAGWYHVGEPEGGDIKPFTPILTALQPLLLGQGLQQAALDQLLIHNPARALAMEA